MGNRGLKEAGKNVRLLFVPCLEGKERKEGNEATRRRHKPRGLVRPEGLGKFIKSPQRVSNPQSSGL
jgi:hypothetical protein